MDDSVHGLDTSCVIERIVSLFVTARDGMVVTDRRWRVLAANGAVAAVTGYSQAELVGRTVPFLDVQGTDAEAAEAVRRAVRRHGHWSGEIWARRRGGEAYPLRLSVTRLPEGGFALVFADITLQKRTERVLTALAFFDPLTGLPNRSLFLDRLGHAMAQAERNGNRLALLVVDLDGFKATNDALGHAAGDELLKGVAVRLRQCVRASDTVARLAGDEFVVVLETVKSRRCAADVAGKIAAVLERPFVVEGRSCRVGASVGAALFPDDAEDPGALLNVADLAMYAVKRAGAGRVPM